MTGQRRPDEMIRILRAEFVTKPGAVPGGGSCVTFTCGATGWRGEGGTIPRTLVHETAFQLDTGGNARGANSVDLQHNRANAIEVAAGQYCFIHGRENRINPLADWNFIFGDDNDIIADDNEWIFVVGQNNTFPTAGFGWGAKSVWVFGDGNSAFWLCGWSMIIGAGNSVNGSHNLVFGSNNTDVGLSANCVIFGHNHAAGANLEHCFFFGSNIGMTDTRFIYAFGDKIQSTGTPSHFYNGRFVWNSGAKTNNGDNQCSKFSQRWTIADWLVAWQSAFQYPIPIDTVWTFTVKMTGTEQGCANSYSWKLIDGVIENDGGNCTILAAPTITNIFRDVATKEWQAVADNVNNRLVLQYRDTGGPDATDCNITIEVDTQEVAFV